MANTLVAPPHPDDAYLAWLYRLQVRELEDYAMFIADPSGRIVTWNQGVQNTFGYGEEEWLGQNFSIIFNEDDRAAGIPATELQTAAEHGRCVDVRWHLRKDNTLVFMTGVLKALHGEDGELIGYSKIFLDETARKRLEDALTQSNADLEQFAFIASHDLQEPLRTILNFSELLELRHRQHLNEDALHLLRTVIEAGERMNTLIRDLLNYSKLAGEESKATSVHLDDDLEAALVLLSNSIQESGALITHDPLPNVKLDRGQMVRLFQNLVGNAIKFRKREARSIIHISVEQQEDKWIISIRDNGIGFLQEHAERIFAPFKRLHGAEYPGTGIGLASCKRIVERYGGRIGAKSNLGSGATFWFTIPLSCGIERFGHSESHPRSS